MKIEMKSRGRREERKQKDMKENKWDGKKVEIKMVVKDEEGNKGKREKRIIKLKERNLRKKIEREVEEKRRIMEMEEKKRENVMDMM